MGKKLTLEEVKQEFINRGYTPLFKDYKNANEKLLAKNNEGYKVIISLSKLKGNRIPQPFYIDNPYTIDNIKLWLKINCSNYELISTIYESSSSKLVFKCKEHGEFEMTWNKISMGQGCSKCSIEKRSDLQRFSIEEIKKRVFNINLNIKIIDDIYINAHSKLRCECLICHNKWFSSWSNLSKGRGCPKCAGTEKLNLDEIKKILKSINPNIVILSDTYNGNKEKLKCKCLICGYEWKSDWSHLRNCKGCPECTGNRRDYTIEIIKQKLFIINPNIEILSKKYINKNVKLLLKCKIDNHEWSATWGSLSHNQGCPKCAIESLRKSKIGKNNPSWKGGISPLSLHLRQFISQWKKDSFVKYNYKCDITGSNKNLIIHHLYGFNQILQETMETLQLPIYEEINRYNDNELKQIEDKCLELHYKCGLGICLCEEEHKKFHSMFGYGNNTPEQYYEFKEMKLKELNIAI